MLRLSYNVEFGYISLFDVIGIVVAYFVQYCYACGSFTVQIEILKCLAKFHAASVALRQKSK